METSKKYLYLYAVLILLFIPVIFIGLKVQDINEAVGLFFVLLFSFGLMINGGYSLIAEVPLGWFRFMIGLGIYLFFAIWYISTKSTEIFIPGV